MSVDYIKASDKAQEPLHLTSDSVGSDLFSAKKYTLYPNQSMLIDVDLHMKIPKGYCGLVSGRSSLALKGIQTHVGIVDNNYEVVVCIVLTNIACYPRYEIKEGDRVGQISLLRYDRVTWKEIREFEAKHYGNIVRSGGFGSTGI